MQDLSDLHLSPLSLSIILVQGQIYNNYINDGHNSYQGNILNYVLISKPEQNERKIKVTFTFHLEF